MTDQEKQALIQQIENDPRVTALADSRKIGDNAGALSAHDLRQLGYNVSDDWGYVGAGAPSRSWRGGGPGVRVNDGFGGWMSKYGIPIGAAAIGTFGVGSLLGGAGAAAPGTATTGGAGAAGGATSAAASGGIGGALKGLVTDPNNLMNLAGVVTALAGSRGGGNGQPSAEAQRLNQITEQRMRRVDPLHQAVTQLAWNRLPTNARQGISPPTYAPLP